MPVNIAAADPLVLLVSSCTLGVFVVNIGGDLVLKSSEQHPKAFPGMGEEGLVLDVIGRG